MAARYWLAIGLLLAGCIIQQKQVAVPPPKPIIETRTQTVVRVERVPEALPAAELTCPPDPSLPLFPTPQQLGQFLADITQVADECRAKLDVLRKRQ
jgi:hypothetical protein